MSSLALYEGDFRNWLPKVVESFGEFKMLFADPPDNIDWGYVDYNDKLEQMVYRTLLNQTCMMTKVRIGTSVTSCSTPLSG